MSNGIAHRSMDETASLLERGDEKHLLSYEESLRLLPWQTDNEYVRSGYRRQLGSIQPCIWSSVACESDHAAS